MKVLHVLHVLQIGMFFACSVEHADEADDLQIAAAADIL